MSDYNAYLLEREQIDLLLDKGYKISSVTENLSGAFVTFKKQKEDSQTLHVKTADGRKYFSNKIFHLSHQV
ncbi:hypothetical protein [Pseudalkalibacillus sp. SCS-8]|uniref:hypothetical protein n=1 Tax=Pseudalkalibacillus nanhaiensis TaxID=3115291 RepID=UPI0032DA35F8